MSEGGEARPKLPDVNQCFACLGRDGKHLDDCIYGEARNHETESKAALRETDEIIDSYKRVMAARFPLGEDHEAGIRAMFRAYEDWQDGKVEDPFGHMADAYRRAAYLSRCPSLERDTEKLLDEADIHAVALRAFHRALDLDEAYMDDAVRAAVVAALDAVRRSPQGEDRSAGRWCAICGEHGSHHTDRHPQGEDHEAGIEAATEQFAKDREIRPMRPLREAMARAIEMGYLSRCPSPERDTELEAVRRELSEAGIFNPGEPLGSQVWRLRTRADVAMAEVERLRSSPERDTEKLLAFGREHGIAALLDHLGLDELGNEVSRLVEALFEAKGAIPSDRGELHRRLGRILSEFSDASKEERVSPGHDPGRTD